MAHARTRIKICGITRAEDGVAAARLGADAIGLVFYEPSPRAVNAEQALAVLRALPPFVSVVGLFVDAPAGYVREILRSVPLDLLQFHGQEAVDYCTAFERPYIKALAMRDGLDVQATARLYASARGLLLDTYVPGVAGGTGERFDWQRVPGDVSLPLILAGGLTPENVAGAVAEVGPYAVDVSGGVERDRGIKDVEKIEAFIRGVEGAG